MKPTARRLGRGLGAFLDFGPADADGAARVAGVISAAAATSVLQTSKQPAALPSPQGPPPPAAVARPAPRPPIESPEPPVDDRAFIDDVVVELTFPDVELE